MKDPEKSHAQSHKSYKKDLQKRRDDSAARSCESYLKDPEKSRARNRESYLKDLEKSHVDSAARSCESYKKDLRRVAEMKLTWLYPTKVRKQLQSNRLS